MGSIYILDESFKEHLIYRKGSEAFEISKYFQLTHIIHPIYYPIISNPQNAHPHQQANRRHRLRPYGYFLPSPPFRFPIPCTSLTLIGFTWRPNPCPTSQALATMKTALAHGANFCNGGEFYGTPSYNSMTLLKQYFTENPADAEKVVLSIKGGITPQMRPDGSPGGVKRSVDAVLEQLGGTKFLDLFECARVDPNTPIETTMGALAEYVKAGKLGGISLSEVKAETIRRAAKVHPIAAVEVEFSLWATDILENGVAEACAELGIPIVA